MDAEASAAALTLPPPSTRPAPTAHVDTFARDHLPPPEQWPEFRFDLPELQYPAKLNCAAELLDGAIAQGWGERTVIHAPEGEGQGRTAVSYRELLALSNRIAHVLTEDLGLVPGNRVLLRSPNRPILAACLLAIWKAGCIAVPTMRLLRARELRQVLEKAKVDVALCDVRLRDELEAAAQSCGHPRRIVYFGGSEPDGLERRLQAKQADYPNVDTASNDVALIAFTSGTTGVPKAALHFHRDVMAMCDCWPRSILKPRPDDIFCGTPPLAFTYGLGVMLCVPMRYGASAVLVETVTPPGLLETIHNFRCTVVATVPTFYRQMAPFVRDFDVSTLRMAISSGEALPDATRVLFRKASGLELIDGFGATELMQTFISHTPELVRRGATGYVIPGYAAVVLDENGQPCPPGVTGRLAVKGPTGCLYLSDDRQQRYVQDGWNVTGDMYRVDEDGYFFFQGRSDDVIVSAGYNISGLEVESMLLQHDAVAECAVVGLPDEERGQIVSAFVVLKPERVAGAQLATMLQEFVKSSIAPYKYPRRIEFVASLPRTESGKLQRFQLRKLAPTAAGT